MGSLQVFSSFRSQTANVGRRNANCPRAATTLLTATVFSSATFEAKRLLFSALHLFFALHLHLFSAQLDSLLQIVYVTQGGSSKEDYEESKV